MVLFPETNLIPLCLNHHIWSWQNLIYTNVKVAITHNGKSKINGGYFFAKSHGEVTFILKGIENWGHRASCQFLKNPKISTFISLDQRQSFFCIYNGQQLLPTTLHHQWASQKRTISYNQKKKFTLPVFSYIEQNCKRFLDDSFIFLRLSLIKPNKLLDELNNINLAIQFTVKINYNPTPISWYHEN